MLYYCFFLLYNIAMKTTTYIAIQEAEQAFLHSETTPLKFIRRPDLTLMMRVNLIIQAYRAQQNISKTYIADLAREHQVSRTFIYNLLSRFKRIMQGFFIPEESSDIDSVAVVEARILAYRFEGKSSIEGISSLLVRASSPYTSVGYISQYLKRVGESLPNTLSNYGPEAKTLTFLSDEIFSKSHPILITVDPISSAILRIELSDQRTAEQWRNHFQVIGDHGFNPKLLSSDEGVGLCAAQTEMFAEIPWQLDTFHGIAHRLGEWSRRLEKQAYKAIEAACKDEDILDSAKSDSVIDKRLTRALVADDAARQAIELYDSFRYLYHYLVHQLNIFNANGDLRECADVQLNMEAALDLMEYLQHDLINKEVSSIKRNLPDLLTYLDTAKEAVKNCQGLCSNNDALRALCLAWQWNKATIKSKKTARKHRAIEQREQYLELASLFINDKEKYHKLKAMIFDELDEIVQASSMVECINSILRPYLNASKNQITQEFLNTFMFYHNHRRYRAGKRKGKTPMEILTGQEQKEDWIVFLQNAIREKEPV